MNPHRSGCFKGEEKTAQLGVEGLNKFVRCLAAGGY
jgi:hypothetical protein